MVELSVLVEFHQESLGRYFVHGNMILVLFVFSIRTTNIQRTIDSARCVIAGMYGKEQLKGTTKFLC